MGGDGSEDTARRRAASLEAYEAIPFRTGAWTPAAPDRMAVLAHLHGLDPAPASRARVLELGCGNGGNLIPLAVAYPRAELHGIDLAPGHVASGQARAAKLALANVRLAAMSFEDLAPEAGAFDYVVVHGLFSWIPRELQERLLETCRAHLAANGVLFVSYNTFPGWYLRKAVREMLVFHTRGTQGIEQRAVAARELLGFLSRALPEDGASYYAQMVRGVERVAAEPEHEHYFAHEYLEEDNHPLFFREFLERCDAHGLRYLANANHAEQPLENLSPETLAGLQAFGRDRISLEQGLDYLTNRMFRQTLLCHGDRTPRDVPDPARIPALFAAATLRTQSTPAALRSDAVVEFGDARGRSVALDHPFAKTALARLGERWPAGVRVDELADEALAALAAPPASAEERAGLVAGLCEGLCRLFSADLVELRFESDPFAARPGSHPEASALARLDALGGRATTNLRHQRVDLDNALARALLPLLDGTRDRAALLAALGGDWSADRLDELLALCGRNGLLVPGAAA